MGKKISFEGQNVQPNFHFLGKVFKNYLISHSISTEKIEIKILFAQTAIPGSDFIGKTPLFFRYSGVNAANALNLQAKRR